MLLIYIWGVAASTFGYYWSKILEEVFLNNKQHWAGCVLAGIVWPIGLPAFLIKKLIVWCNK